jgi:hypothetical protein
MDFIDSFDSGYQKNVEIEATKKYWTDYRLKEALLKEKYKNNRFICVGQYTFDGIMSTNILANTVIYDRKMKKYYLDTKREHRIISLTDIKNNNKKNHKYNDIDGDYYYQLYDKKDYSPMIMHNNRFVHVYEIIKNFV